MNALNGSAFGQAAGSVPGSDQPPGGPPPQQQHQQQQSGQQLQQGNLQQQQQQQQLNMNLAMQNPVQMMQVCRVVRL
jgi:hypothetical protein